MTPPSRDRWHTISDAARICGVSRAKIRDWISKGLLTFTTVEDRRYIPDSAIDALLSPGLRQARTDRGRAA